MSITISIPDALRQSVEASSGGKNTVLYDAKGYPSVMVSIPRFNLEDIDTSLGTGTHPAFIINGATKSEIFIGKFQAIIHDDCALSLPAQDPGTGMNFDRARTLCSAKGPGWHLMTQAEWAAIGLWCWKQGHMPRGNTNYGKSSDMAHETGRRKDDRAPGDRTGSARTLTGSGPASWYHDDSPAGIADLNGNVWEWAGGLRLQEGEIQIIENNNAADNTKDQAANSTLWKAIAKADGSLVAPGTAGTLKYDAAGAGGAGAVQVDDTIDSRSNGTTYAATPFEALQADTGITAPAIMKQLGLFPVASTGLGSDYIWSRNVGERLPLRGGDWGNGSPAGVFALNLYDVRTIVSSTVGFRPAFAI